MNGLPSLSMETSSGFCDCATLAAVVFGSCTGTPVVISGAATMKMISSTSITSTIGVTLISDIGVASRPSSSSLAERTVPMAMASPSRVTATFRRASADAAKVSGFSEEGGYSAAAARAWGPRSRARRLPSTAMQETKPDWMRATSPESLL
jgi:hypothetical protein